MKEIKRDSPLREAMDIVGEGLAPPADGRRLAPAVLKPSPPAGKAFCP